jgi:predicted acylesterase/phospholipase RssA
LKRLKTFWILLVLVLPWAGACAHYQVNRELARYDENSGYRFDQSKADANNTDSLFVCLAFSGGGTRAAALSYGVLKKLAEIKIEWEGKPKSLLDEVDCISSVSGGSFTAAYYALFHGRVFSEFPDKFLYRNIQGELLSKLFNPINLARILSPYFSRIDLAAELYHDSVFDENTFGALLASKRRPFLILNATNLALGERFEFTQDQFDVLGSDLADYPIARAVAASAAFPFLLSPVSLKNQPKPENYRRPREFENALNDFGTNRRRYEWAKNQVLYEDKEGHPFVHLMDGGLADNLGVRVISDSFRRGTIRQLINNDAIKRLVIVIVNAGTAPPEDLDKRESPPGLATVAYKVATISMDNYTFETVEMMKELRSARLQAQRAIDDCQGILKKTCPSAKPLERLAGSGLEPFVVDINLQSLREDPQRRDKFLSLPTSFSLERQQVDDLIAVGGELLEKSQDFQSFMQSLKP